MTPFLRSLLFVPGDSERKQTKALSSAADALLLDLEDSVAQEQLPAARVQVKELLQAHPDRSRQQLWVRVNSLSSGLLLPDLAAVFAGNPDGIIIPKAASPAEVVEIGHYLSALEVREGREVGTTRMVVIATETPHAVLTLSTYSQYLQSDSKTHARLSGLTWGSEDLSAAMGISTKTDTAGNLTLPFQLARSLCVIAATALNIQAIDSVYVDFKDAAGLRCDIDRARRDGFTGKLAIHPDQVAPINAAFQPSEAEQTWAKRVVAAFAAAPAAGVLSLDGQMIDKPHLLQARLVLQRVTSR